MWHRVLIAVMSSLFVIVLMSCSSEEDAASQDTEEVEEIVTIDLSIGAGHPVNSQAYVQASAEFLVPKIEERVEKETNYRINWTEAYGGTVADVSEVLDATESGLLDIGLVGFPFEPSRLFLQNFNFFVPFDTPDSLQSVAVVKKVFEEFPILSSVFEEDYNQKLLGLVAIGNYQLVTNFPVNKVEDLKGRKIAAVGPNMNLLEGTGAVPVQSNVNEAYTSIQTGVYEGWIIYPSSIYGTKMYEVAPYQTTVNFGAITAGGVTVNLNTWNELPEKVQEIIQEVVLEYEVVTAELVEQLDKEAEEKMLEEGYEINELSLEERKKWIEGLPNIPNDTAKELDELGLPGTEVFSTYLKLIEEDGYEFPKKWEIEK